MSQLLSSSLLTPQLKHFFFIIARRTGICAVVWVAIFYGTQWMKAGVPSLFAPMVGAIVGLVYGWVIADNAVDEAGFSGLPLWVIIIGASWLAIWLPEVILQLATGWGIGGFGRWMVIMFAMLLSLAAAMWRTSADE